MSGRAGGGAGGGGSANAATSAGWSAALTAGAGPFRLDVTVGGGPGVVAIIGPNGSGKTTLLRVLAGAVPAERAELVVGGRTLAASAEGIDVPMEERRIGYVPQGYGLFPHLDVLDNVAFGLSTAGRGVPSSERRTRARKVLEELGAGGLAGRRVQGLSGGEQQRVALARALVIEPELLLLDEPLAALDVSRRRTVRDFLADRLRRFARPTVLATHDVRDVAALDAVVYVLDAGRVAQRGSLAELRAAPASDFVAEFVDGA